MLSFSLPYNLLCFLSFKIFRILNNYLIWNLVQKMSPSLDSRFEKAQDKLLESLYGAKKVLLQSNFSLVSSGWACPFFLKYKTLNTKVQMQFPLHCTVIC